MNIDVDIDACKQGEREALGNLYRAYSNKLMRICQHYVADESTAEDILHDAFIIIFTSLKNQRRFQIGRMDDNHSKESCIKIPKVYREE